MDSDHDGAISKVEALQFLGAHGHNLTTLEADSKWFAAMDANKDGKLEKNEFDKNLWKLLNRKFE